MTYYEEPTDFAWIITEDHLYRDNKALYDSIGISDATGTTGPSESPNDLTDMLTESLTRTTSTPPMPKSGKSVSRYTFRMWDDDGELYYTGRLVTYADKPSDDALYAPLSDFGGPNAGAVLIKYTNHPEWTMEY